MNTEKTVEKFLAFLEREGAREKFTANIADESINGFPELVRTDGTFNFEEYESLWTAEGFVSGAFFWDQSPEGDDFWRSLSEKWRGEIA